MRSTHFPKRRLKVFSCLAISAALCACAEAQPAYSVNTYAGNGTAGFSGDGSAAVNAQLNGPAGIAIDSSGNLYVADQVNNRVRKITKDGNITTVAGNGTAGYTGDNAAATNAELSSPQGVAVDSSGNLFIADSGNHVIRKVSGNNITTVAGFNLIGPGYSGDNGPATNAQLWTPSAVAVDASGKLYIADTGNSAIRMVSGTTITTVAGNGFFGFTGDGVAATSTMLNAPSGVAVDSAGKIYIGDSNNNRVRVVGLDGIITTLAGSSTPGFSGDGGPAAKANLKQPRGVAIDGSGNIFIVDSFNFRIRMIAPTGTIFTVAGSGVAGSQGNGGPATVAQFLFPTGIAIDGAGNLYVTDSQNNRVQVLNPSAAVPTIFPGGVVSSEAFGGSTSIAPGTWIEIYGSTFSTTTRQWTGADFEGSTAPVSLDGTTVTVGGRAAYIDYISPGQVNAQVPFNVNTGAQQVTVTNAAGTSAAYTVTMKPTQPGLLAPPSFTVNGKQYVAALLPDGATYVLPAEIA